jgi:hypothetical protein
MKCQLLAAAFATLISLHVKACEFTPLAWQQQVKEHPVASLVGQRKNIGWSRDKNVNFVDDEIENRYKPDDIIDVVVDMNRCLSTADVTRLLLSF